MEQIGIDEFSRIELRVATVVGAEAHPRADRLVVLQVDIGEEQRQLVAGIRAQYTPEELIGRQIVVVANLQPATLRGIESQGMLLAASDGAGNLVIIGPEKPIRAGAVVR
jgi:methionyl-tRNA synthetase